MSYRRRLPFCLVRGPVTLKANTSKCGRMAPTETQMREYAGEFAEAADDRSAVRETSVDEERFPPAVTLRLTEDHIPRGVHDLIDRYQGDLTHSRIESGTLAVTVSISIPWKDAGTRTIRTHGNSLVLTLPPEALEAADLDEEQVDLHARDGEVHVKKHEGGPHFP